MNTVVLGENVLGFGLGKCTGDSGDNLYVRILADGGIPFLLIFIFFILSLIWLPIKDKTLRKNWRIFIFAFLTLSFFYDTLYISRSAPLVFAILAVVIGKTRPKLTQSNITASNDHSDTAITVGDSDNYSQSPPKIAVCLAAHNGSKWLDEQINSIFAQSGVDITLFVSIDSSPDDTEKIIQLRAISDTRIKVLPSGEHFGGAARNFFRLLNDVDFSDFDYVSLADQDDIWFPDKLSRAHEMLLKNKADAYSSNVIAFWPSGKKELINKSQSQKNWDFLFEGAGPGCTFVMKPSLVRAIQNLLKKHWSDMQSVWMHDWFIYAFARANGYRWLIDEHASMLYRQHGTNEVGANKGISAMIYRVQKVLKGDWGLNQVSLIAKLVGLGKDKFVQIWIKGDRKGMLRLALLARQCRRRPSDVILFFIFCLLMAARP
ncbi:MAG: glycosyltransferase [Betaproteobacteria bacterium]|nr:glycosyltransferase [Betaproteobacteria bacterium]